MEPQIQYGKTSDGVSIAYATFGRGLPIVFTSSMFGGLHMASYIPGVPPLVDQLVELGWKVILYDGRGAGASDRDATNLTLDARVRDLETVIDNERIERCALVGTADSSPTAIAYAARCPGRVSHLVLRNAFATGSERDQAMLGMIVARALRPVAEEHWGFFTLTLANALFGYANSDEARKIAEGYQTGISARAYLSAVGELDRVDTSDLLASLAVPTLVLNDRTISPGADWGKVARRLASRIPGARLMTTGDFPRALGDFLSADSAAGEVKASEMTPSGTAVILFADIADSTALTERLGDAAFREKARMLDEALRRAITSNGGTAIDGKLLGDGVLAVFGAAREAIACAQACHEAGSRAGLLLHVGIHAGDVIREANNVYGGAVNTASRVAGEAAAGETLVSDIVRGLAKTSAGVAFEDRGEHALKGIEEAQRLYEVRWRAEGSP